MNTRSKSSQQSQQSSGEMDKNLIRSVVNSISRFIHLVACLTLKSGDSKGIEYIVRDLKLLKPVLDEVSDAQIQLNEELVKSLEELDVVINQCREIMEKRSSEDSKLYNVLRIEPMSLKIRDFSMEICCLLLNQVQSTSIASKSAAVQVYKPFQNYKILHLVLYFFLSFLVFTQLLANVIQHCMQEFKCQEQDLISELIEIALKNQKDYSMPSLKDAIEIMEKLGLTSAHDLLLENIILEKKRMKAELEKNTMELNNLNDIITLLARIRCIMAKFENYGFVNGFPIPSYFRCPLSLELMQDPVIVASGQTYERSFIEKWLEHGLKFCPKTNLPLAHTNLTPNFTVKGLIANWCEGNNVTICDYVHPTINSLIDFNHCNSFNDSLRTDSSSRSEISYAIENTNFQSNCTHSRSVSLSSAISSIDIYDDELIDESHVYKLINGMKSKSPELQISAASELRRRTKHNMENRILITKCGAIIPLLSLLTSKIKEVQENAVTTILNLSINNNSKVCIAEAGAIEHLVNILSCSNNTEAQENSAAALYSLSSLTEYKAKIGQSGAIKALVSLLASGTMRGKKDATAALFSLSICHENKARIVQAGAVKYIIELMDPCTGMIDKCVALLVNICSINEGRVAVAVGGGIPLLVEIIENGSERGKENAASALFQMCINNPKYCCLVLQEGAVPPLVALSQFGTPRAKEKAQQILSHFRTQREGTIRKQKQ